VLFDFLFFVTSFFWVVSQWVIYHELIKQYPYGVRYRRFFIDIARFTLMFIILSTSFLAHTRFFTLILSITIWHVLALVWHLWNRELEADIGIQLRAHVRSVISYGVIAIIFLLVQSFPSYPPYGMIINLVIMAAAVGSMIIYSATRLHYILVNPKQASRMH
jgi:hypothetical protein